MSATLVSPASTTVSVTSTGTSWYLKDPLYPALNIRLEVVNGFNSDVRERAGKFDILGRSTDFVVSDGVSGEDIGALDCLTLTAADYTALIAITTTSRTLYLTSPFGEAWYVFVLGRQRKLIASAAANPYRTTTLNLANVDAP